MTVYSLIDGLQRTNTILSYVEKPTKFFDKENIDEEILQKLESVLGLTDQSREEIIKIITNWVKNLVGFEEEDGFASIYLASELINKLSPEGTSRYIDVNDVLVPFNKNLKHESNISNVKIPIIIYSGDKEYLPMIFERLNSKGTKLNKYQIYAATWIPYGSIGINNSQIIDLIKAKYDALIEEGLQVDNYDPYSPAFNTSGFNYFEYVFGLGKYITGKYEQLFGSNNKDDTADSIGFNICTACLCDDIKKMADLPSYLKRIDLDQFEESLLDAISLVNKQLKPFIGLNANKRKGNNGAKTVTVYHSEYQIVSLIGKVFKVKYNSDLTVKESWNGMKEIVLNNIPFHYLYDILREYWRGSGDSKINELIKNGSRYELKITKNNWDNILSEWFDNQLQRKEKSRVNIRDTDILFLKYIYTHLFTMYQDVSPIEYEIDHIISVNKLKEISGDLGIPMSAVSNLCLIDKKTNKEKKDLDIYSHFSKKVKDKQMTQHQADIEIAKIEKFTFTTRQELQFVKKIRKENYLEFIGIRFDILKNKFYELNNIE